nr:DUF4276 family protein [uncultured Shewanella sp.]
MWLLYIRGHLRLAPYLANKMIFISATQVTKPGQKGGDVRFSRVSRDLGLHLKQRPDTFITTLVDYYGTSEWPGLEAVKKNSTPKEIAHTLNGATAQAVNELYSAYRSHERFIPFIAMHEFEAFLFSDADKLADELGIQVKEIHAVLDECDGPEAINNSPETAPSKRLNKWSANGKFAKTTMGIAIAQRIGIATMRAKCPLFGDWLTSLEQTLMIKL